MSKQFGDFSVISPNKTAWKVKNISVSAVSVTCDTREDGL